MRARCAATLALGVALAWVPAPAAEPAAAAEVRREFDEAMRAGRLAHDRGDVDGAEALYREAESHARRFGERNLRLGRALEARADLYREHGRLDEAEPLYLEVLAAWERLLGAGQPHVATTAHNLAALYLERGETGRAEPLLRRAIGIWERHVTERASELALSLEAYAALLQRSGRREDAAPYLERARALRAGAAPARD